MHGRAMAGTLIEDGNCAKAVGLSQRIGDNIQVALHEECCKESEWALPMGDNRDASNAHKIFCGDIAGNVDFEAGSGARGQGSPHGHKLERRGTHNVPRESSLCERQEQERHEF